MTENTKMPEIEVVVGEISEPLEGSIEYNGECRQFQNAAECFKLMDELPADIDDINEMMNQFRRTADGLSALSSSATTVSAGMATHWISHMRTGFKRRALTMTEEQHASVKKIVHDLFQHGTGELEIKDILMLYSRGLEAHHEGRYREMFERVRPCIPYFNTNVLVWIRISEALIYEFYEEVWEFADIYQRLFEHCPRNYKSSEQRAQNELRRRHEDMTLRFAETATLMTYALAKHSSRDPVHYAASALHGFFLLKQKRYSEAIEAVEFSVEKFRDRKEWQDELCILLTYKAEGLLGMGKLKRAIEYCLKVKAVATSSRVRHRAIMLMAMAYMRKMNFKKAHECVMELLSAGRLDEVMLENVTLLGLNLAHLMGNTEMFKRFELLLQKIVY